MNNYKTIFASTFLLCLMSSTCNRVDENCHKYVTIVNNTEKPIYFYDSYEYPDTSIRDYNPSIAGSFYRVNSFSRRIDGNGSCLEGSFTLSKKVQVFIFDTQVVETTPWDTIMKKYMILKRYDLTLENIQEMNWIVTYP